ncbi:hypothetical protein RJ634_005983 [Pseudomonas aeruginosa]|nr:hypothetical protein [Pseudomonas aeruginosa]
MSEVKRFDVPSMRSLTQGEQAVMGYEVVLASDYDALAAKLTMAEDAAAKGDAARQQCGGMEMEIEELRAELAELRARVVVIPALRDVSASADPEYRSSATGYNLACGDMARLNGLTVSEGLLRRISNLFQADMGDDGSGRAGWFPHVRETVAELRALLDAGKEDDRDEA